MSSLPSIPKWMMQAERDPHFERVVDRCEDLYDLDGETFFRCHDGQIETGTLDALGRDLW